MEEAANLFIHTKMVAYTNEAHEMDTFQPRHAVNTSV